MDTSPPPTPIGERKVPKDKSGGSRYRAWAERLRLTFSIDVLTCAACEASMTLVAMVKDPRSIETNLRGIGESTSPPERSPSRGPPYWKSRVLRRTAD